MLDHRSLTEPLLAAAHRLREAEQADVVVYSGDLFPPHDFEFMTELVTGKTAPDVVLVLTTYGGSADTAYRIAKCLQRTFDRVRLFVPEVCKSAGTLIALGAHDLVMTGMAELGPLDVQLRKPDALGERLSGLTPVDALKALQVEAFETFEYCFLEVQQRSGRQITTQTAARMAARMAIGLMRPVYAQVNPFVLGEYQRAMTVADAYGARLEVGNVKSGARGRLLYGYPSHEFVIDIDEAEELFESVREPSEVETDLMVELVRARLIDPLGGRRQEGARSQPQGFGPIYGYVAARTKGADHAAHEPEQNTAGNNGPAEQGRSGPLAQGSKSGPSPVVPPGDRKAPRRAAGKPHETDRGVDPTGAPG